MEKLVLAQVKVFDVFEKEEPGSLEFVPFMNNNPFGRVNAI